MLHYPNFNKPFLIHTDASDIHQGGTSLQDRHPIACFSRMLTNAQQYYTTTDKELLRVVEMLKEFHTIL